MYERHKDIESIYRTLNMLQQMTADDECYSQSCELIRVQLQKAIAFETGHDVNMTRYSSYFSQ